MRIHQSGRRRLRAMTVSIAVTASMTTVSALLPANADALLTAPSNVVTTTIRFPDGTPAAGAEVRLLAEPATGPEIAVAQTTADATGRFTITVPTSQTLIDLTAATGGTTRLILSYTDQQGSSAVPIYFKGVTVVPVSYNASTGMMSAAPVQAQVLKMLPQFEQSYIDDIGALTLDEVGTLANMADATIASAVADLNAAMAAHGYLVHPLPAAYNIGTMNGVETWITYLPHSTLVQPTDDADIYQVFPLTTGGLPGVDTTFEGQLIDDVVFTPSGSADGEGSGPERGKWGSYAGTCWTVIGPKEGSNERYQRRNCYSLDQQAMDSAQSTSYWQFSMDSQGAALTGNKMERLWVEGAPWGHGTAPMTSDGLAVPRDSDTSQSNDCSTVTDTINVSSGAPIEVGFSRSWAKTHCPSETYGPKLYSDDGHHASIWQTTNYIDSGQVRAVAMAVPIKTPTKEGTPTWNLLTGQWVHTG